MTVPMINLYGTVQDSIVDGPGLRYSVFVQGCTHACPGCHNPESQPKEGGEERAVEDIVADIKSNPLIHDVTLTGGEPFEQAQATASLARLLKDAGYGIWTYTGYLYEDLMRSDDPFVHQLIDATDVLVDGPFIESKRSLDLDWCGSANQRLIDIAKTKRAGKIVLWEQPSYEFEKPSNW